MDQVLLLQRIEIQEASLRMLLEDLTNIKRLIQSECVHTKLTSNDAEVRAEVRRRYQAKIQKKESLNEKQ